MKPIFGLLPVKMYHFKPLGLWLFFVAAAIGSQQTNQTSIQDFVFVFIFGLVNYKDGMTGFGWVEEED